MKAFGCSHWHHDQSCVLNGKNNRVIMPGFYCPHGSVIAPLCVFVVCCPGKPALLTNRYLFWFSQDVLELLDIFQGFFVWSWLMCKWLWCFHWGFIYHPGFYEKITDKSVASFILPFFFCRQHVSPCLTCRRCISSVFSYFEGGSLCFDFFVKLGSM